MFLTSNIELLVQSVIEKGWFVGENFISPANLLLLNTLLLSTFNEGAFKHASIGKDSEQKIVSEIRSDLIYWLDINEITSKLYLDSTNRVLQLFNRKCFLGLTNFDAHFANFPVGAFYKLHYDSFKNNNNRKISFIIYLNLDWLSENGGELSMNIEGKPMLISPKGGTVVCFMSDEIEHEVLPSTINRLSITGWFSQNDLSKV